MPRGQHPNSRKNLEKGNVFNSETARIASIKSHTTPKRSETALLKNCLKLLAQSDCIDENGNKVTGAMAVALSIFNEAIKGNPKMAEMFRDTIGEKPVERVALAEVDPDTIKEVEDILTEAEQNGAP